MTPVNLDLETPAEARMALRDRPDTVDALLHGTLRDLSYETWDTSLKSSATRYRAELQMCMETPTGEVLWSDTLAVTEDVGLWATLCRFFPSLVERPYLVVLVPVACLLGLCILLKLLTAMTRIR